MTRLARSTGPLSIAVLLALGSAAAAQTAVPASGGKLAKGKFLVASRELRDPNFAQTVVLLVDYEPRGALGVVVNRPSGIPLGEALPELKELRQRKDVIFLGGPVGLDRMLLLVRSASAPPGSLPIFGRVYASGDLDVLRAGLSRGDGLRAFAGYAGWGAGQLDAEVARGDWLIGPADARVLFDAAPNAIWDDLVERFTGGWAGGAALHFAAR